MDLFGSLVLYVFSKKVADIFLQIPEAKLTLQILSPSIFLVSVNSVLRGYFNGRNNINITAKSQSIEQLAKTVFTIIIVEIIARVSNTNTTLMAAAATMATTLATLFSLFYLYIIFINNKKKIWIDVNSSTIHKNERIRNIIRNILIVAIPISLSAFLSVATKSIDAITIIRIMKKYMEESETTKLYGILSGKIDTLIMLPLSFNIALSTTLVPTIAGMIAQGKQNAAKNKIEISILISIVIGVLCTAIMGIFSKEILNLLFPNAASGMEMLRLSSLNIIILLIMQTINGILQAIGKVKISVIALLIGLIVKLIGNIILIRIEEIGIYGAIISSLLCHLTSLIICIIYMKKNKIVKLHVNKMIVKPIVATTIMIIISYYINITLTKIFASQVSLIISLIIGIVIYMLLIIILKIIPNKGTSLNYYGEKLYRKGINNKTQKSCKIADSRGRHFQKARGQRG